MKNGTLSPEIATTLVTAEEKASTFRPGRGAIAQAIANLATPPAAPATSIHHKRHAPDVAEFIAELDKRSEDASEAERSIYDILKAKAIRTGDVHAVANWAADLMQNHLKCTVYGWCIETGDHHDHLGAEISIPSAKTDEGDYLTAHLLHFSASRPTIGLEGSDLNAEQARQEAVKLRQFAAELDALADQLAAAESTPMPIVIEEAPLDPGVPMVWRSFVGGLAHFAWDPEQATRADVEAFLLAEFGPYEVAR